jgi:dTDP-4-amino-4,6-dideoxygalactose transaminase
MTVLLRTDRLQIGRDEFIEALKKENIATGIHFRSLHIQKYYRETFDLSPDDLPHAADVTDRLFSLPLYPRMSEKDLEDVIRAMRKLADAYRVTESREQASRTLVSVK